MPDPRDQRLRSRVRLELPVRVRQIGPPRDSIEITRTMDVSRNGILFRTREIYEMHSTVWITMPFNPNTVVPDPEFHGSVVRIIRAEDGSTEVGVQFHSSHADHWKPVYTPVGGPSKPSERRGKNRVRMTLPIRVRHESAAEESVTLDVSRTGVLFRSTKNYPVGHTVWVTMPYQPGARLDEVPARVVRVVDRAELRGVALHFTTATTGGPSTYSSF